jgi:hypothetical protein
VMINKFFDVMSYSFLHNAVTTPLVQGVVIVSLLE